VKIIPHSPKTEYGLENHYSCVIYLYPSIGSFVVIKKKYAFRGQPNISLQSPETELGVRNQYVSVMYSPIGNFIW
jgi:hypothetical protein